MAVGDVQHGQDLTVMGLQSTVDYEVVWDASAIGALADRHGIRHEELNADLPVDDERSLLVALLALLREGGGGERYVSSSAVVAQFAAQMVTATTLGGTCLRAALAMRIIGVPSLLHLVSVDRTVRKLLPADCPYICSAEEDTLDPHLILQYPAGAVVRFGGRQIVAPRPNRVIFANDPPARSLILSDQLGDVLERAGRFMVSGFNAIQEPDVLALRLDELGRHLERLPVGALVFYEDAGFHIPAMNRTVRRSMAARCDVFSLNEDEAQEHLGRRVDLSDAAQVHEAVQELLRLIPGPTLVLHTQRFSLAAGPRARVLRGALEGGVVMASTRYVHGNAMTAEDYGRTAAGRRHPAGVRIAEALMKSAPEVVVCPGLQLETKSPTTIGLGDAFVGGFMAALSVM